MTIKEILVALIKRFWGIMVGALIMAILLGCFGAFRAYTSGLLSPQTGHRATLIAQYDIAQQWYDIAQANIEIDNEYREKSIRLHINQQQTGRSMIFFTVVPTLVPTLENTENIQQLERVSAACLMTMWNADIYPGLQEILKCNLDKRFISELIDISKDTENILCITVLHDDLGIAREMCDYIFNFMYKNVNQVFGEQKIMKLIDRDDVLPYFDGFRVKWEMDALTRVKDAETKHEALIKAENVLADNGIDPSVPQILEPTYERLSFASIIKYVLKYVIIGFVLGGGLACVWYLFLLYTNDKLRCTADIRQRYNLELLAEIPNNQKQRQSNMLNKIICWLEGSSYIMTNKDISIGLAVTSINLGLKNILPDKKLVLSGTFDLTVCELLATQVSQMLGREVLYCGSVLSDSAAMEALLQDCVVVLMESYEKVKLPQIDNEILRIERMNIPIIGIIVG